MPPSAGADQETSSLSATVDETDADCGACGTVVEVTEDEGSEATELPYPFVATTVNVYPVFEARLDTVNGEDAPVAVNPPGLEVTVYEVAGGEPAGKLKATVTAPLLYALFVPTSVAESIIGLNGSNQSFCCADFFPLLLLIIYLLMLSNRHKLSKSQLLS